jgi:hypothetical protein
MNKFRHDCSGIISVTLTTLLAFASWVPAQAQPSRAPTKQPTSAVSAPGDESNLAETRGQLIRLLRMTPTLTGAVAHDPSLLADKQYVARSNPALAQFLEAHPEVAQNPEFYLFASVGGGDRTRGLQREVWPEVIRNNSSRADSDLAQGIGVALVFAVILTGLFWLARLFVEKSRWNRAFKTQTELQSRLLDKFTASGELIAYLETDAGKRILQLPTPPARFENGSRPSGMLGRIMTPIQLAAVLIPVGIGLQILRGPLPNESRVLLVLGTLALTLGIGLAIAAGASWLIARRYGLLVFTGGDGAGHSSAGQE